MLKASTLKTMKSCYKNFDNMKTVRNLLLGVAKMPSGTDRVNHYCAICHTSIRKNVIERHVAII